jgi:hypothetical protein
MPDRVSNIKKRKFLQTGFLSLMLLPIIDTKKVLSEDLDFSVLNLRPYSRP